MLFAATTAHAQEIEAPVDLPESTEFGPGADARAQAIEVIAPIITPSADTSFGDSLFFSGLDTWRYGGSAYAGSDWTLPFGTSLAPVLRLFAANGIDDFKTRFVSYRTDNARASILPGVRLREGSFEIKLFAGGDYEMRASLRSGFENLKHSFGARFATDVWWEPDPQWMVSGSASATTIEEGANARLAAGWRSPFAWIGPEVLAMHDVFNTQYRAGAHLTGIRFGATEWSVAGGYVRDSFHRSGPYARIGLSFRL